jgi:hypothetical protein
MTTLTPDYSHYFWQGDSTRLRPWRLEDAELRFMASLDSPTLALHQDGIVLPTSVELQRAWLEKAAGLQDDGMLRFVVDNLDGALGWVTLHTAPENGTAFGVAVLAPIADMAMRRCRAYLLNTVLGSATKVTDCLHTNAASIRMHRSWLSEEGRTGATVFNGNTRMSTVWADA